MRFRDILRHCFRSLFRPTAVDDELDEELRYHIQRQVDEDVAAGMSPVEARQAALRAFSGFDRTREECRDMRKMNLIDNLRQDLRFTARQLARSPGFAATAILVLALGLCASVAIFAFVDAALIKPLPYPEPNRLVGVYEHTPLCPRCNLSYPDYVDWKRWNKSFVSLEAYNNSGFIVTTPAGARPAPAARISAGFFRALGISPVLGRGFRTGEDLPGAARGVILSHAVWQERYGSSPAVIGQTAILDGDPYVIIGVLPTRFQFSPTGTAEYYAPLMTTSECGKRRSCHNLYGLARLRDGATIESAQADTTVIARRLESEYPDSNRGQGANVSALTEVIVGDIRPILLILLGGATLLLVIACVNVASLLLVRSESRRREMAVRSAMGASRARLIGQFVTEGTVLVGAASIIGLVSASWTIRLLSRLIPEPLMARMPFLAGLGLNPRVLGFAVIIALSSAAIFAGTPALRLTLVELRAGLAEGGRGSAGTVWRRLGARLVVVELATAMVLLVGAGLLGQSLYRLLHVYLGIQVDRVATLEVDGSPTTYPDAPKSLALGRQVVSRISALPGVESAALVSFLPVQCNCNTDWIRFVGKPYDGHHIEVPERDVSPAYFSTLRARLLRGRYFTESDDPTKPNVAIVNQTLVNKYFPGEDPIGKQFGDTQLTPRSLRTIVGVIEDIREGSLDSDIWPTEYLPFAQSSDRDFNVVVRSAQRPESVLTSLAAAIHQIDPGIATSDVRTLPQQIEDSPSAYLRRSAAWLVGGFAAVALLLGVVGLYGVIAYSVGQRTREIGVRIALGAERKTVYALILKEAAWLAAAGTLVGILASVLAASLLGKLLFGVASWDIPTLAAVAALLSLAALLASFIPARRAASVNPVEALRSE